VPSIYSLDKGLGRFVGDIKNGKTEITGNQWARLSALGFDWETYDQKREREWMKLFAQYEQNQATITRKKIPSCMTG
jgi:hypothetical protein